MDQRDTTYLQTETTEAILAERIDPVLCAVRTQILDLLDDVSDDLPFDLQSQLHDLLTVAVSGAYRQGLRDAKVTLADLLNS